MTTTYTARNGSVRGGIVEREKALEVALLQIEKQFGKGSVMRMSGDGPVLPIEFISTGSLALDLALGIGGVPRGRVIEIYGPEASGKTTVGLHIIAEAQRAGGIAAFIDAEHALDVTYARNLGVDTDAMLVSQPDTGEQALEIADMLVRSGAIDVIVVDSVAAPGGNGRSSFACTPNHQIRTPGGWREAQELAVGDRVMEALPHRLSPFQWEVLLGGLMGDGALSPTRSGFGARYCFGHGVRQAGYGDWKASLFGNLTVSRSTNAGGAVFHDVQPLPELAELREAVYVGGRKVFSHDYLKRLTPLSLAVCYMDDGSFALRAKGVQERTRDGSGRSDMCIEAIDPGTRARLVDYLADNWGIRPKLVQRAGKAVLVFGKDETAKLHALIAPFVHPSMQYKLLPRYRGQFGRS